MEDPSGVERTRRLFGFGTNTLADPEPRSNHAAVVGSVRIHGCEYRDTDGEGPPGGTCGDGLHPAALGVVCVGSPFVIEGPWTGVGAEGGGNRVGPGAPGQVGITDDGPCAGA